MMTTDSKAGLTQEELTAVAKEQIELVLGTQPYSHENAVLWNRVIVSNIIAQLMKFSKPYKFMGMFVFACRMVTAVMLHVEFSYLRSNAERWHRTSRSQWILLGHGNRCFRVRSLGKQVSQLRCRSFRRSSVILNLRVHCRSVSSM
ncbi:hypothetical protein M514_00293, partial [Trichuris suis]